MTIMTAEDYVLELLDKYYPLPIDEKYLDKALRLNSMLDEGIKTKDLIKAMAAEKLIRYDKKEKLIWPMPNKETTE